MYCHPYIRKIFASVQETISIKLKLKGVKEVRKRIKGWVKNPGSAGEASLVGRTGGYHDTWETGKAHFKKYQQKLRGVNRPAE